MSGSGGGVVHHFQVVVSRKGPRSRRADHRGSHKRPMILWDFVSSREDGKRIILLILLFLKRMWPV